VHAIKGASQRERAIDNGNTRVGFKWNGRQEKHGPILWHVGTNLAKDRFHARLTVRTQGPGYVHLCAGMSDEWFKQLAGEQRVMRRMLNATETRWTKARQRIEVKDCLTYAIWLEERLDLWSPQKAKFWAALEQALNPVEDLFSVSTDRKPEPVRIPVVPAMVPPPAARHDSNPFTTGAWTFGRR
jgi:phage terminase large subunit GpA-like protein